MAGQKCRPGIPPRDFQDSANCTPQQGEGGAFWKSRRFEIRNEGRSTTNSVGTETTQNLWFQLKVSPFPFICGTNKQPAASGKWQAAPLQGQQGKAGGERNTVMSLDKSEAQKTCYFCSSALRKWTKFRPSGRQ